MNLLISFKRTKTFLEKLFFKKLYSRNSFLTALANGASRTPTSRRTRTQGGLGTRAQGGLRLSLPNPRSHRDVSLRTVRTWHSIHVLLFPDFSRLLLIGRTSIVEKTFDSTSKEDDRRLQNGRRGLHRCPRPPGGRHQPAVCTSSGSRSSHAPILSNTLALEAAGRGRREESRNRWLKP